MATSKTINSNASILDTNSATLNSNAEITLTTYSDTLNSDSQLLQNYGGNDLETGYSNLVTLYRMNEASWSGVPGEIADAKGSNDAAAMGDATTTDDDSWFGKVGTFSGTNTGMDCGSDSTFHTTNVSVSVWVYPTAASNTYNDIINSGKYRLILRSTQKVEFWVYSTDVGWVQAVSNSTIPLNQWTHLAGTYDGTAKLYVDGNLQSTTGSGVVGITWAGNSIFIGQSGANTNEYTGKLDEAAFFNTAISATDVKNISKQGTMIYSNSYVLDTNSSTIDSDSYVLDTSSNTIDTDSYITKSYSKNKISLSYIMDTSSSTIDSDGWILLENDETLNSNYSILASTSQTINSNAQIFKEGYEGTLSSDAYITDTYSDTINSNAHLSEEKEETLDSDSWILSETSQTLNSDYYVTDTTAETLDSNSYVLETEEQTLDSDGYVLEVNTEILDSNSYILKITDQTFVSTLFIEATSNKTLNSDSCIIRTEENIINSNSQIKLGGLNDLTSDYFIIEVGKWSEEWEVEIFVPQEKFISQDASIKQTYTATIDSNSYLLRWEEDGIVSNAYIQTDYTTLINSIYYIRRTDTTKPYVYEAEYINKPTEFEAEYISKPVIVSANSLSYDETMI
jgi:hypothetical protein